MPLTSTLPSLSFRALMPRRDTTGGMNICRRVGCVSGSASLLRPSLSFRAAGRPCRIRGLRGLREICWRIRRWIARFSSWRPTGTKFG